MSDKTGIEWTDATWNPIVGCSIVSPGCTNCYAMKMAARIERMGTAPHYAGLTRTVNGNPVWTGTLRQAPESILTQPLRWKKPRRIFVNSMSDLFHEDVPDAWIDQVFAVMALSPQHVFQVLTKRPERMREYLTAPGVLTRIEDIVMDSAVGVGAEPGRARVILIPPGIDERIAPAGRRVFLGLWPLPNVWLGTSVEDQRRADERIPHLLATPAAIRFISAEPLLGPVDLTRIPILMPEGAVPAISGEGNALTGALISGGIGTWGGRAILRTAPTERLDWVIVGGESGPGARPMHPDWARSLRDQCAAAKVPFFFKQWGEYHPSNCHEPHADCRKTPEAVHADGAREFRPSEQFRLIGSGADGWVGMCHLGKSAAGRLLDSVTHDGMPQP